MNGGRLALFDVRRGERGPLLRAGGGLAAILCAHTIAETARDAMFLTRLSAPRLAIAYGLLALLALLALRVSAALIRRAGRRNALVATLLLTAYGDTLFYVVPPSPASVLAFYLWTGLLAAVIMVQFWLVAGETFTSAQAKRLFGPILALGGAGGLLGAFGAAAVLAVVRVEQLLPIAAGMFLLAAAITVGRPGAAAVHVEAVPATPDSTRLRDHPYALRLAALVVLATAVALVVDYLFKAAAARELAPAQLAGFFARYNGAVAGGSLVLQLLGATWLLRRLGVLGTIALMPAVLLLGGIAVAASSMAFAAIIATKGTDATLRQSVQRVSTEMLWLPVPADLRGALRVRIDTVGFRAAQGATAVALLGINLLPSADVILVTLVIGLTAAWLGLAIRLRRDYLAQLRLAVLRPAFVDDVQLDVAAIEVVLEALTSAEPRRVLAAIGVLTAHGRARLIPSLILHHEDPAVLLAALDAIARPERRDWLALAERLLAHPDRHVRIAALRALAQAGVASAIGTGLADADPAVRGHALFWQAQLRRTRTTAAGAQALVILAAGTDDETRTALLDAIRTNADPRWTDVVLALARDPDAAVVDAAVRAIERAPDPRFVPLLVDRLGIRAIRASVRAALLAIGDASLAELGRALRDPAKPTRVRLHIPATMALFASERAGELLLAALAAERTGVIRFRILRALARLASAHRVRLDERALLAELRLHLREHFRLLAFTVALAPILTSESGVLLRALLEDKLRQALDRAFLVVQALQPGENLRRIERVIEQDDGAARAHALELLDILTRAPVFARAEAFGLREALLLACEDLPAAERVRRAAPGLVPRLASAPVALERLRHEPDTLLAAAAAHHARATRGRDARPGEVSVG